jgi:predicted glycoside hydrolase/deacetylase ChbG (UPF0249 family)
MYLLLLFQGVVMQSIFPGFTLVLLFISGIVYPQNTPQVLLRLDDNGMNHAVNMAIKRVADLDIPFSTSVMFACPWYQETVSILKKYPKVSVGVHLTLNSEWKHYKWGPVSGRSAVPSLVDSEGYFLASTKEFLENNYSLEEVEKELAAQIERGLHSGLKIDYIDFHMGTAVATPELQAVVEKLAKKYKLGISRYFNENYKTMFDTPVEKKKIEFIDHLTNHLKQEQVNLIVLHVAKPDPEMKALVDMNNSRMHSETDPLVSWHRSAELAMLLSDEFLLLVKTNRITLVNYSDVLNSVGLNNMKAPPVN